MSPKICLCFLIVCLLAEKVLLKKNSEEVENGKPLMWILVNQFDRLQRKIDEMGTRIQRMNSSISQLQNESKDMCTCEYKMKKKYGPKSKYIYIMHVHCRKISNVFVRVSETSKISRGFAERFIPFHSEYK